MLGTFSENSLINYFINWNNMIALSLLLILYATLSKIFIQISSEFVIFTPIIRLILCKFSEIKLIKYYWKFVKHEKLFGIFYLNKLRIIIKNEELIRKIENEPHFQKSDNKHHQHVFKLSQKILKVNNNEIKKEIEEKLLDNFLENVIPLMNESIKELSILLESKSNRKMIIDAKEYAKRHTLNVIGICIFGKRRTFLTKSKSKFYENCDKMIQAFKKYSQGQSTDDLKNVRKYLDELIENNDGNGEKYHELSLISILFSSFSENSPKNREYAKSLLLALTVNINDIMTGIMSLVIYEISKYTKIQENLRSTIREQIFDQFDIPRVTSQTVNHCKYVSVIINEVVRKYPQNITRTYTCIADYKIPYSKVTLNSGSSVIIPDALLTKHNIDNYEEKYSIERCTQEYTEDLMKDFHVDENFATFDNFASKFIRLQLNAVMMSLVQVYDFENVQTYVLEEELTKNFENLPYLPIKISSYLKRGKTSIFEESLITFRKYNTSMFDKILNSIRKNKICKI